MGKFTGYSSRLVSIALTISLLSVLLFVPGWAAQAQDGANSSDSGMAGEQPENPTEPDDAAAPANPDLPQAPEGGGYPWLHGYLYYSQDSNADGLYRLNTSTGAATHIGSTTVTTATVGLTEGYNSSVLFGSKPFGLLYIDTDGSGASTLGAQTMEGMAFNPTNRRLYASANLHLYEINVSDGTVVTELAVPPFDMEGLAADPVNKKLFGLGGSNNLVSYDITSNTWSTIGDTGLNWGGAGLAFDPTYRVLYAVSYNRGATLYWIEPDTAVVHTVGPTGLSGSSGGGLAFVQVPLAYVAATWADQKIHFLNENMADLGSIPALAANPNGITTNGELIYTGHYMTSEVIAYDFYGIEQFRWKNPTIAALQGMDFVGNQLAIVTNINSSYAIGFYEPGSGKLIRTIPAADASVEGIAYDGTLLWELGTSIYGVDPSTGTAVQTWTNPAAACSYGGTGITAFPAGQLTIACEDGSWYRVVAATGIVAASGNNGLNTYDLKVVPPAYLAATWQDDRVHFLDRNLVDYGSFPAGEAHPNGVTTDGSVIYTVFPFGTSLVKQDFFGKELSRIPGFIGGFTGLTLVGNELAIINGQYQDVVQFYNPETGAYLREIPGSDYMEGLYYDGTLLWEIGDSLFGVDPLTGSVVSTLSNAAAGCLYTGTGITGDEYGNLVLACADGRWFRVSKATGAVVSSGNNGLYMYDLACNPFIRPFWANLSFLSKP